MDYIVIKYKSKREWKYIKNTLSEKYNITSTLIGSWSMFGYIGYSVISKTLTNYSEWFIKTQDIILCSNATEFTYKIGMLFNIKKEFRKEDLKSGMVVKTRNNKMYLVVDDLLISNDGFMYLNPYNSNLKNDISSEYDIIEVHDKVICWGQGFNKGLSYILDEGKLIWKREETKEYTMQEIADKLGIPIEELRIKNKEINICSIILLLVLEM